MAQRVTGQEIQKQASAVELHGLSESEVADRRKLGLGNTSSSKTIRSYIQIIRENIFVLVNIIMFALGLALIILGQFSDALLSVGVAFFNVLVLAIQDNRISLVESVRMAVVIIGIVPKGLLLVPFAVPPTKAFVGGNSLDGDWRPTLLALGLLAAYAALLSIPPLRAFFELAALDGQSYLLIGLAAVILRWLWRSHLFERFLQLDWREI